MTSKKLNMVRCWTTTKRSLKAIVTRTRSPIGQSRKEGNYDKNIVTYGMTELYGNPDLVTDMKREKSYM